MPSVNFNNNNFNGKLEGKSAYEYYQAIKGFKKQNVEETIKFIREVIGSEFINDREFVHPFFEKVFIQDGERNEWEGGIKLLLSTNDSLYSDSNIAKLLECMGTMIIESERKRDNPDKYIKVFKSSEMFAKAIDEQNALSQIVNSSSDGKYAKTTGRDDMFVLANQMNYKLEKRRIKLNDKDLEKLDKEFGSKYFSVRKYLRENGYADAGVSLVAQDIQDIKDGKIPITASTGDANGVHVTGRMAACVGNEILKRLKSLGYINSYNTIDVSKYSNGASSTNPDDYA